MVVALGALLAVAIHVVPAELLDDVLLGAEFIGEAQAHLEMRANLV